MIQCSAFPTRSFLSFLRQIFASLLQEKSACSEVYYNQQVGFLIFRIGQLIKKIYLSWKKFRASRKLSTLLHKISFVRWQTFRFTKVWITIQNRLHSRPNFYLSHSLKMQETALFQPESSTFSRGWHPRTPSHFLGVC